MGKMNRCLERVVRLLEMTQRRPEYLAGSSGANRARRARKSRGRDLRTTATVIAGERSARRGDGGSSCGLGRRCERREIEGERDTREREREKEKDTVEREKK